MSPGFRVPLRTEISFSASKNFKICFLILRESVWLCLHLDEAGWMLCLRLSLLLSATAGGEEPFITTSALLDLLCKLFTADLIVPLPPEFPISSSISEMSAKMRKTTSSVSAASIQLRNCSCMVGSVPSGTRARAGARSWG